MDAGVEKGAEKQQAVGASSGSSVDGTGSGSGVEARQGGSGRSAKHIVLLEICVYAAIVVMLVVCASVEGKVQLVVAEIIAQFVLLFGVMFWPMPGTVLDRVIGLLGGEILIFGSESSLMTELMRHAGAAGLRRNRFGAFDQVDSQQLVHVCTVWAIGAMVVLAVFVILGFLQQMLRRERTDMVLSLSQGLMIDAGMVASSGWMFVPVLFRYFKGAKDGFAGPLASSATLAICAVIAVAVVLIVALSAVSVRWYRDYRPLTQEARRIAGDEGSAGWQRDAWIGLGLSAVMFAGLIVYLAVVALVLLVG